MTQATEIAISMNTQAMGLVAREGKWPLMAYHTALANLKPGKGVQVVSFDGQDNQVKLLKGANRLCEMGILKPFAGSKGKFYIPRTVAFATHEPTLESV